jgi:HEAT repeat protein
MSSGRNEPITSAVGWTLIHCASSNALGRLQSTFVLLESIGKGEESAIAQSGGAESFKRTIRRFLLDEDPVARGWAALTLASINDQPSKTEIAKLLNRRQPAAALGDDGSNVFQDFDRGRAAMALGLLGAREYAKAIGSLLRDSDEQVRGCAALGLGYLGAQEYAKDLAALLTDPQDGVRTAAASALAEMGAREWSGQIAELCRDNGDSVAETACYALAKLRAREQAGAIAGLLQEEYKRGVAAKALAILGAGDCATNIARLLSAEKALDRKDACVALGILKSDSHERDVAELLEDKEGFVRNAAALGLVLMDSTRYSDEVLRTLRAVLPSGQYASEELDSLLAKPPFELSYQNFHPLVLNDLDLLIRRADDNLSKMKSRRNQGR